MYDWRPSICRLFGFSVFSRKDGLLVFRSCKPIQGVAPHLVTAAQEKISAGLPVPRLTQYSMYIFGRDPGPTNGLLPINQALMQAMERYGLQLAMDRKEREGLSGPSDGKRPDRKLAA
jgi:hypothetical protein